MSPNPNLSGATCIVAALVSAKDKSAIARVDEIEADLVQRGAVVVGRLIQRRGVSKGGVKKMGQPLSPTTVISSGKTRELAQLAATQNADTIVFLNDLKTTQASRLSEITSCRVLDAKHAARAATRLATSPVV